jgi:glycosyltransferase involved in cell wall biosynthesis
VVSHGMDGLLVPPADKGQLAQALIALLNDKALRQEMGARGRIKALEHSWESIARRVFAYYVRVLSEPPWNKEFPELEESVVSVK